VAAHIDVVEVPKLLFTLVECLMSLRKPIASVVAEPNVVPRVDQSERWRQICIICQPEHHITHKAMLHQNGRLFHTRANFLKLAGNSVDFTDVAVCSHDCVLLRGVAVLKCNLLQCFVGVISGCQRGYHSQ